MLILGIESSCDDTSVALVKADDHGFEILAELTANQIDVHKKYGGVVPEIAGRKHAEKIMPLIEEVLNMEHGTTQPSPFDVSSGLRRAKPDVIAVTAGPGLITGLLVGVEAAKTLSYLWKIPLVAVNHIEGHIHSVEIPNLTPPSPTRRGVGVRYPTLALIVSGGHTELIYIKKQGQYELVGKTRDDAAGECFDKAAKLLGLDYPGGPKISAHATKGNPKAIDFPRPMINDKNFDFSFSGLKTSALYWLRDHSFTVIPTDPDIAVGRAEESLFNKQSDVFKRDPSTSPRLELEVARDDIGVDDFCASFEQAIIDVLVTKTIRAAKKLQPKTIILAGGVSANKKLQEILANEIDQKISSGREPVGFLRPLPSYSMDNAAMIAVAGYYQAKKKKFTSWQKITADPNWELTH